MTQFQTLNIWIVLVASLMTALFTGLGVLPFIFLKKITRPLLGIFNAVAAGLMLGASYQLISEGMLIGAKRTLLGLILGLLLIVLANVWIKKSKGFAIQNIEKADARKIFLILGVMTAHSFAEGIGVGVSFGGGQELGFLVSTAIAIHNIPEGLAISLVLIPKGFRVWSAAGWSIFSSLPQPLMAVPAYLFILFFTPILPIGLGLAAGAMIWMLFAELLADALKDASRSAVGITITFSFISMLFFQVLFM